MKKLEQLKQLRERIQSVTLADGKYAEVEGGECKHCIVGHLLLQGGVSKEQLSKLDDKSVSPYSDYGITFIIQEEGKTGDFVNPTLREMGFEDKDWNTLSELQNKNDGWYARDSERKSDIIYFLDEWIKELEAEVAK